MTTDPATAEDRIAEIRARLDAAQDHLGDICTSKKQFRMSIPADPSRDSDLILEAALSAAEGLLSELEAAQARLAKVAEATPEQVAAWIDPEAWRHVEPHSSEYFKKRGAQAEYEANFAESVRQRREPSLAAAKRVLAKLLSGSARALGLGEEGDE